MGKRKIPSSGAGRPFLFIVLICTAIVLTTGSPIPESPPVQKIPARAAKAGGRLKPEFQPVQPDPFNAENNRRPKPRDSAVGKSSGVGNGAGSRGDGYHRSSGIAYSQRGQISRGYGGRMRGSRIAGRGRGGRGGGGRGGGGRGGGRGRG